MRILVATDAWHPQVNGVVRTYECLADSLVSGVELKFLTPNEFRTIPCPTYAEIRLAIPGYNYVVERLGVMNPDAVHIATEGPVGWMARAYCLKRGVPFTTCFHTRFAEYIHSRFALPERWIYGIQRRFHAAAAGTMVSTASLAADLERRGFARLMTWSRGVDTELFRPRVDRLFGSDQPVLLYVGRVAVEKNVEAFLKLNVPGRKVVVGDGPLLARLRAAHPDVLFIGVKTGEDLARCYASADVFVFPSRTDTFGMVMLEAMAAGVPVAAFPVTGPVDVVRDGISGALDEDLAAAVRRALTLDRVQVRTHALEFSWKNAARQFVANIETVLRAGQGSRPSARRFALAH